MRRKWHAPHLHVDPPINMKPVNLPCLKTIPYNQSVPQHGSSFIEIVEQPTELVLPGPCPPDAMTHQPNYVPSLPTLSPGTSIV